MQAISREYLLLFNAITDAEETLCRLRAQLIEAQRQAEELFLEAESDEGRAAEGGRSHSRSMERAPAGGGAVSASRLSGARP